MPRNEVVFDNAALSAHVRHADIDLCDLLISCAEAILAAAVPKSDPIDRIRVAIRQSLHDGDIGLAPISRTIGIGTRTLQRKLTESGTSFRELLTKVRQEMAEQNLRCLDMSVSEISYLLGYSSPSEFHRAFRHWTGIAPKKYRLTNVVCRRGMTARPSVGD